MMTMIMYKSKYILALQGRLLCICSFKVAIMYSNNCLSMRMRVCCRIATPKRPPESL